MMKTVYSFGMVFLAGATFGAIAVPDLAGVTVVGGSDNRGFLLDFRGFRYRVDVQGYREKRPQGWTIRPVTGRPVTFNFTRKVN